MPGFIDAHLHLVFAGIPLLAAMTADVGYLHQVAGREAQRTVMRDSITVRDVGGPTPP